MGRTEYATLTSMVGLIAITLVSPAALALAPVIWLLGRKVDHSWNQIDWRTGLKRWEHGYLNPGIPFEAHPPKNTTFTAHPHYIPRNHK